MLAEIIQLEETVIADHPVGLLAYVRLKDGARIFRMVRRRQHVAQVVEQGGDDRFLVGTVAKRARRRLQ